MVRWKMKKVIAAFTLCFMVAGVNSEVDALNMMKNIARGVGRGAKSVARGVGRGAQSAGRKVGDLVKGRKTNDVTKSIDAAVNSIRGMGNDFKSSGGTQFSYVMKNYLNTASDLDFLAAYSAFVEQSGKFLSWLETLVARIRTEYATSIGAQNRASNTEDEQKILQHQQKDELGRENMRRSLEVLMGNVFPVLKAQIQSLAIILLTVMREREEVPEANLREVQRQINDLNKSFRWNENEFANYLKQGLSFASEELEIPVDSGAVEYRADLIVKQISLIKDILVQLNSYVQNGDKSGIEKILQKMDYYSERADSVDKEYVEDHYKRGDEDSEEDGYDSDYY